MTMGQLGIGLRSSSHVNYSNPASYTAFDSLSFVFDGGFNSQFVTLSSSAQSVSRNYASLGCLLFGMPVNKWWKTSLGLVPFSDVGYNIEIPNSDKTIGKRVGIYAGSGGINRLYWGNGFQLSKKFSAGFNISYLFGSMKREETASFPDSAYTLNARQSYYISVNDLLVDFGAQYRTKIKEDMFLNLGVVYSPSLSLAAKTDVLAYTFMNGTSGTELSRDTIIQMTGYTGKIVIPMMIGGGFSLEKTDKWMIGLDCKWQNWKNFRAFNLSDSLVNSFHVSIGGEIIPKIDNYTNFLARMHYRLGFSINKTYLRLRGNNIYEKSVSFGFGIPLRGMKTMLNIGGEYGSQGNTSQDLIRESYFKVVIGFSIYERWFVKRKYF